MAATALFMVLALVSPPIATADILGDPGICTADDPGFGGTKIKECPWTCSGPSTLHLEMTSSDEDASVEGSGSCGDGTLNCGWAPRTCSDTDRNTIVSNETSAGKCSGQSDELWSSGLKVTCSDQPDDKPPTTPDICIGEICIPSVPGVPGIPGLPPVQELPHVSDDCLHGMEIQMAVAPKLEGAVDFCSADKGRSSVTIWIIGDLATATSCRAGHCWDFKPVCKLHERFRICDV